MYATWINHRTVTNQDANKEVLIFNDTGLGVKFNYWFTSSPYSGHVFGIVAIVNTARQTMDGSLYSHGARPALYQEGTLE